MKHFCLANVPAYANGHIQTNGLHAIPRSSPTSLLQASLNESTTGPVHGSFSPLLFSNWQVDKVQGIDVDNSGTTGIRSIRIKESGVYVVALCAERTSLPNVAAVLRLPCDVELAISTMQSPQALLRLVYTPTTSVATGHGMALCYLQCGDPVQIVAKTSCNNYFLPYLKFGRLCLSLYMLVPAGAKCN